MFYYKQVQKKVIVSVEAKSLDSISPGFVRATVEEWTDFMRPLLEADEMGSVPAEIPE